MPIVLIATDNTEDAKVVKQQIVHEYKNVFISTDPEQAVQDFESHHPDVLVLAFNDLEKAERYYLGLYRFSTKVQVHPHRTVILCNKDEVRRAYELCQKDYFDDYILFWPVTHDFTRLPMAIHHAMRELTTLKNNPSSVEIINQTRRLAALESILDWNISQNSECIETASNSIARVEHNVKTTLDEFSQRLTQGEFVNFVEVKDADGLQQEINRFQQEQIHNDFNAASKSIATLKTLGQEFKQKCTPHLESARVLRNIAEKVPATLMVVDDDEMMRNAFRTVLVQEKYQLMLANSGIEALNLLRKRRPDLILMDMKMPGIDGIETIRRIKSAEQFVSIPIIMVTGYSEKNIVTDCLKVGAVDFVVKPFNRKILLNKIHKILYEPDALKHLPDLINKLPQEAVQPIDPPPPPSLKQKKSWRNSRLLSKQKNTSKSSMVLEISWIQLKPGMKIESVFFEDKPFIKNCIADEKIISNIVSLRENTGISPIIKIQVNQ